MKTSSTGKLGLSVLALGAVALLLPPMCVAVADAPEAGAPAASEPSVAEPAPPAVSPDTAAVKLSPAMKDVLKMLDARVGTPVVKAYIENYPYGYNASASQIIALKDRGVP